VNSVLLNPLPFSQPDQLVTIDQSKPNFDMGAVPYPNFLDLRKENQTFTALTILRSTAFSLIGAGEPERVNGRYVSADFCAVFDVKPVLGRTFAPGEDAPGVGPVAVISHDLWQRKFGGVRTLWERESLDDKSGPTAVAGLTSFARMMFLCRLVAGTDRLLKVRTGGLSSRMGRPKPGVTIDQGQADLSRFHESLAVAHPEATGKRGKVSPLKPEKSATLAPLYGCCRAVDLYC
jgi:hypothetical protein